MHRISPRSLGAAGIVAGCLLLAGCGGKSVTRVDPDTVIDLSGRWNDTDSRLVSEDLTRDCLSSPWLRTHLDRRGAKPVLIVGAIRNKSLNHIPVETFIKEMERSFINDGRVRVVADAGQRLDLREEREAMQGNATPETIKRFGNEVGADYVLMGEIHQLRDEEGGERADYYQTDLELIDVESNEKVWIGLKKIKKFTSRSRFSG